ncbi:MAG: hypothetical protein AAFY72_08750 [Cyanobacteria bacterium J06649_4]
MTANVIKLSRRINMALNDVERVVARTQAGWQQYQSSGDDLYLDSVALGLHGFYNGIEGLLENIATSLDKNLPGGSSWHRELLEQMAEDFPGVRPAVISADTLTILDEYLRFRHVVRNIYSYRIDPELLAPLAEGANNAFTKVSLELSEFSRWLILV